MLIRLFLLFFSGKSPPSGRHARPHAGGIAHHARLQHRRVENVPQVPRAGPLAAERSGDGRHRWAAGFDRPAELGGYLIFSLAATAEW